MEYNKIYNYLLSNLGYRDQDHWSIFDKKYHQFIKNSEVMKNFRRNGISNMLETALPSQERNILYTEELYEEDYNQNEIKEIIKRYKELILMVDKEDLIFNNNIGSPRKYIYENNILNFDDLYHVYSYWQIKRFLNILDIEPSIITEIGGGYGNLADKIKQYFSRSKYIIIDLPEVLLIQYYYLINNNSNYKIIVFQEGDNVDELEFDILLMPFNLYHNTTYKSDLIISTRALGEMPKIELDKYLKWIQNNINLDGTFYTVNRYVFTKSKDQNKIRDYNFDEKWKVLLSKPTWLQSHLHEFILQRSEKETIPLSFTLQSFPISTPPPGPIMEDIQTQKEWIKVQKL